MLAPEPSTKLEPQTRESISSVRTFPEPSITNTELSVPVGTLWNTNDLSLLTVTAASAVEALAFDATLFTAIINLPLPQTSPAVLSKKIPPLTLSKVSVSSVLK